MYFQKLLEMLIFIFYIYIYILLTKPTADESPITGKDKKQLEIFI